ncbi:MAG: hypothetical protein AAGF27_05630 [Pseudomonadota bacterium]
MRHPSVQYLIDLEPLKTWSLIVTILGDLDGAELTGSILRTLLERIDIKPEAIRVALYRLKSDGWITSRKSGREAAYRLSPRALRETETVRADVYGTPGSHAKRWQILLQKPGLPSIEGLQLGKDIVLIPQSEDVSAPDALVLEFRGDTVPSWVQEVLVPRQLMQNAEALVQSLAAPQTDINSISPEEQVTLRILVLHHWRRLALREGSWAHMYFLPEGIVAQCGKVVTLFLGQSESLSKSVRPNIHG